MSYLLNLSFLEGSFISQLMPFEHCSYLLHGMFPNYVISIPSNWDRSMLKIHQWPMLYPFHIWFFNFSNQICQLICEQPRQCIFGDSCIISASHWLYFLDVCILQKNVFLYVVRTKVFVWKTLCICLIDSITFLLKKRLIENCHSDQIDWCTQKT